MIIYGNKYNMVLFGVERLDQSFLNISTNANPCLVVITNEITNEILQSIDVFFTKNIIFQIPCELIGDDSTHNNASNMAFDIKADMDVWEIFMYTIKHLEFRGMLVKNQLSVKHFECMKSLESLYIGSIDYVLFEDEDISKLPLIRYILFNEHGVMRYSINLEKWIKMLELNGCTCRICH